MKDLTRLRSLGWSVAVHNDYKIGGLPMTFWLFTHPNGRWIKGEATSDKEAIEECLRSVLDETPARISLAKEQKSTEGKTEGIMCPCCTSDKEPEECICPEWCPNS